MEGPLPSSPVRVGWIGLISKRHGVMLSQKQKKRLKWGHLQTLPVSKATLLEKSRHWGFLTVLGCLSEMRVHSTGNKHDELEIYVYLLQSSCNHGDIVGWPIGHSCSQQVDRGCPSPLLSSGEVTHRVPCPVLGSPVQKWCDHNGESLMKSHKEGEGTEGINSFPDPFPLNHVCFWDC